MTAAIRNNVRELGRPDGPPILFAHGYGCDQHMWRHMTAAFEDDYRVVLFDHVGAGRSDVAAYDPTKYASLDGYASDVVEICRELDLRDTILVGHSVSAMIAVLAHIAAPDLFSRLVLVAPSAAYINDGDYRGGFTADDIAGLLDTLEDNYLGWSSAMAPTIMGNPDRPDLGDELTASFCRANPQIAQHFARVTFTSDNRADLGSVDVPTLVLQCREDVIAPMSAGLFVADAIADSTFVVLEATGHVPNLSAPGQTSAAIVEFLKDQAGVLA